MKNVMRPLLALCLVTVFGTCAHAATFYPSGFGNESFVSMHGMDSFNLSVRKRLESVRIGSVGQSYGRSMSEAPLFSSDEAFAMAPSSRGGTVASGSARRRQLDCVYYSGFTVWGDMYQTWVKQSSRGSSDGYQFRTTGPAIGFDYSTGGFSIGLATTYNWGKMRARDFHHDRKTKQYGLELYGQYNTDLFYINGTLGYGHTTFRSDRDTWPTPWPSNGDKYSSNSWNIDGEFGWKFRFSGLNLTPHVGIRYFHDRRGSIDEGPYGTHNYTIRAGTRNGYIWEMPVGVDLAYEINTGGMVFVPRVRAAWVPQLSSKRGGWSGTENVDGVNYSYGENAARRDRNGYLLGAGLEAKITKAISAHIDYNCNFRSKAYEHHWNLGVGFTF